jgi:hypothetical protein
VTKGWWSAKEKKKKRKEKRTGMRLTFVSGRRAGAGGKAPLAFASGRGSYVPAEKRKTVSGNEKKKKKNAHASLGGKSVGVTCE